MQRNRNEWKELGGRVASARSASHLSQQELATKIEIDRTALAKIESGARGLDALELAKLAEVLKRPIDWFVSQPLPATAGRRAARKGELVDDSPADIILEDLARDTKLLQTLQLLKEVTPYRPKRKIKTIADAEVVAEAFRRHLDLADEPIRDLQQVAERAGLHAFCIDLDDDNLDGSYLAVGDGGVALINGRKPTGRRRFTLAHELGHHLFQDPYSSEWVVDDLSEESREKVINAFAIHLLLPGQIAKRRWRELAGKQEPRRAAILLAVTFGLSWTALCLHLTNLGVIDQKVRRQLENDPPHRHDFLELGIAVMDDLVAPSVPPRFAQAVIRAYKGYKISGPRALTMMRGAIEAAELPEQAALPLEALRAEIEPGHQR